MPSSRAYLCVSIDTECDKGKGWLSKKPMAFAGIHDGVMKRLQPLFAAGHADTSSPAFAAAARSLGVSTQQLSTALMHAKQSLAQGS